MSDVNALASDAVGLPSPSIPLILSPLWSRGTARRRSHHRMDNQVTSSREAEGPVWSQGQTWKTGTVSDDPNERNGHPECFYVSVKDVKCFHFLSQSETKEKNLI